MSVGWFRRRQRGRGLVPDRAMRSYLVGHSVGSSPAKVSQFDGLDASYQDVSSRCGSIRQLRD